MVGGLGAWSVVRVEQDLSARSRSALRAAGLRAGVRLDGRDAVIEPDGGSPADLARAAAVVAALPGVRTVRIGDEASGASHGPGTAPGDGAAGGGAPPATGPTPAVAAPELVIRFPSNAARLTKADRTALDALAERIRQDPRLRVRVAGHADGVGSRAANLELSRQRAEAVADRLTAAGVPAERVTVEAYGDTEPVARDDTARGRSLNRRVEVVLQEGP